jgi:hypothetical protein
MLTGHNVFFGSFLPHGGADHRLRRTLYLDIRTDTAPASAGLPKLVQAFGAVEDNPSYKIVSSLPPELALHDGRTVRLLAYPEPVKVAYKDVLELIPALYRDYPKISFFVHLGVNGGSRQYHVERRARKGPYNAPGVDWKPFKEAEHPEWKGYLPELYTRLDVDALVKRAGSGVDVRLAPGPVDEGFPNAIVG